MIQSKHIRKFLLLLVCLLMVFSVRAQNREDWDSLVVELDKAQSDSARLRLMHKLGYIERLEEGETKYIEEGLSLAQSTDDYRYMGNFFILYGEYYIGLGNYSDALAYLQKAIKVSEDHQEYNVLIHANYDVGVMYYQWKNYLKAEEYVLEAIRISEEQKDSAYMISLYNGIGSINNELKRHKKAKRYMLKNLELSKQKGSLSQVFLAYINLGVIYNKINQRDSSLYYNRLALKSARQQRDTGNLLNVYSSMVRHFNVDKNWDSTGHYVNESLKLINNEAPIRWRIKAYSLSFDYFKGIGETDSALYFMEHYYDLKDSLFNKEQLNKITELETNFETERYQDRIKNLEQQNKIQALQLYGSIAGFVLVLLVLILSYRSYKLKANLQKQNHQLSEAESKVLKERVKFQQRESAANALYIVKQNRLYDTLLKDLKRLNKLSEEDRNSAFQSLILDIQESKQNTVKKDFEIKFKRTHQNFYKKMKEQFPTLTKKDLDLCAYLKLNMSTKEIASLTNASVRSIEVSRSRLRKKLNVESGVNLSEYIRSL